MTITITNEYPGDGPAFPTEDMALENAASENAAAENAATENAAAENAAGKSDGNRSLSFLSEPEIRDIAERVICKALEQEGCPYETEVSLTLTDDAAIREINAEMRSLDKSTDVLSFPMVDFAAPADFAAIEAMEEDADFEIWSDDIFNPDSGELMLGDIVISVDHCLRQAGEYGHSVQRELAFLIAHSMLHLMGYDHMTPAEAAVMEERQERILTELGYTRD